MTGGWRRWLWLLLALLGAGVAYAALGPADWQIRLGLHWLAEHFLVFFAATVLACVVCRKPMRVAAVLLPIAVGLEVAQGLTLDRTPDIATVLVAAAVALAALLTDAFMAWRCRRKSA